MISSELEELIEAASRLFVLRDGITVAQFEGEQVTEARIMAAMAQADDPPAAALQ
jgi:ribose transport system ATP-binding protein